MYCFILGEYLNIWWIGGLDFVKEGVWQWLVGGFVSIYNGWGFGQLDGNNIVNCMMYWFFNYIIIGWVDDVCFFYVYYGYYFYMLGYICEKL